jgi:hypothetical protein
MYAFGNPRLGSLGFVVYLACVFAGLYIPVLVSKAVEKANLKFLKIICGLSPK